MESQLLIGFLISGAVIVGSIILGVAIAAWGQLMLAVREIDMNTRKERQKNQYKALNLLSNLISAGGYIIMIIGVVIGVTMIIGVFQTIKI